MRRAVLAALSASGVSLATLAVGACSLLAGYEDLRFAPDAAVPEDAAALGDAGALAPIDLGAAAVYSVYPSIFSPTGDLAGVSAQLTRIRDLGFNVLSLMPVTPIGHASGGHPTYLSPYCVQDYYSVDPSYGSPLDLLALVQAAHKLGMYVLLDEQINQSSWDNPLITQHPEYYVHTDGNVSNVASIAEALSFADVAQLDYSRANGLAAYMTTMLSYWLTQYGLDGFRFLTADVPQASPLIPATFWRALRTSLESVKPGLVMWADEEDPTLANAPFALDYGWILRGGAAGTTGAGLQQVANGADAAELQTAWTQQESGFAGALHTSILQTWDFDLDTKIYGGSANAMAAAAFNFTIDGVPMLWNGEEVANDTGGVDTHTAIDWSASRAATFTAFYESLLALRNGNAALQQGTTAWLTNSAPGQVVSFTRSEGSSTFLVVISFAPAALTGTLDPPAATSWTDVSPAGSPGGTTHAAPPSFSLAPYDFAVFRAN